MTVPGSRLGPYEIIGILGAGGMGEVYRARDPRLNRDVAIKVLPGLFASDPERLARFEREAQLLASLNHPHIAHVYGVEEAAETRALVMELVEGEDLAARIARGPLSMDEAVAVAKQIAEALDAAHERGVIHRDLKPANIKVRDDGAVKVLDFGLAKALDPAGAPTASRLMNSPTLTSPATVVGTILGTAAYMSPEQAKGKAVDKRSDIWAFGVVLYEMLTGRHPFGAETTTEVLGAIVLKDVDWSLLPPTVPARLRELLRRCLEKDPKQRLRDIGDARHDLEARDADAANAPATPARRRVAAMIAVGLAAAAAGAAVTWLMLRDTPAAPSSGVRRLVMANMKPLVFDAWQAFALAPDGSAFAFRGRGSDGVDRIFLRDFGTGEIRAISGTDGGRLPFFSPDGTAIGFFAAGQLKRVAVGGGPAQILAPARSPAGGTWMDDGSIVFVGDSTAGVERVPASGGTVETVLPISDTFGTPSSPWALPGSTHVILARRQGMRHDVVLLSLKDRQVHLLAEDGYSPAWVPTGYVVFHQDNAIMAVPTDPTTFRAAGSPFVALDGIGTRISYQTRLFAVSADGTLVHTTKAAGGEAGWSLISIDRKGQETRLASFERHADSPRLSPDGTRVAFRTPAPLCDVWVHDLERGSTMRLTNEGDNHGIVWSRDGTRIFVSRLERDGTHILSLAADGSGDVKKLATFSADSGALPTSSAGDVILVQNRFGTSSGIDIVSVPVSGGNPTKILAGPFDEGSAALSPDGRLMAYVSNESGRNEVYLRPLAEQSGRLPISTAGGTEPAWSPDGRELFYKNVREAFSVTFTNGKPSRPQLMFSRENALGALGGLVTNYDPARGGRTFVAITGQQWTEGEVGVVLNWFSDWTRARSGAAPRAGH